MKTFLLSLILSLFIGCNASPKKKPEYSATYLNKHILGSLDFRNQDLMVTPIQEVWYYVRKDGKAISTIISEDGNVERFHEGLARTRINGKIGFFDKNLDLVLAPRYDFAFPFYNGVSEICMGCKEQEEGRDALLNGGKWKQIDRRGLLVEE